MKREKKTHMHNRQAEKNSMQGRNSPSPPSLFQCSVPYNCVHVIDLSAETILISSCNTIMRKGRLAVVFLGSIFLKTLKMHYNSQVKSLLKTSKLTYIVDSLTYSISNNTHPLPVVSTTSCYRAQNSVLHERSTLKSVQNEEMTGQTSNVAFMLTGQFLKNTYKN